MDAPALKPFRHVSAVHQVDHDFALLPLWILALVDVARAQKGAVSDFASLAVFAVMCDLRFAHAQISTVVQVTHRWIHCRCRQGKRKVQGQRPGFDSMCRGSLLLVLICMICCPRSGSHCLDSILCSSLYRRLLWVEDKR